MTDHPRLTPYQQQLVLDNRGIVGFVLGRYFLSHYKDAIIWPELSDAANYALIYAALKYDPARFTPGPDNPDQCDRATPIEFSTYATKVIWSRTNHKLRSLRCPSKRIPYTGTGRKNYDAKLEQLARSREPDYYHSSIAGERAELIANLLLCLNKTDAEIVSRNIGLTSGCPEDFQKIGATLGITRERVRQRFARSIKRIKTESRKLGKLLQA